VKGALAEVPVGVSALTMLTALILDGNYGTQHSFVVTMSGLTRLSALPALRLVSMDFYGSNVHQARAELRRPGLRVAVRSWRL
jgi:hypothetical protein